MTDPLDRLPFLERGLVLAIRQLAADNGGAVVASDGELAQQLQIGLTTLRGWRRHIQAGGRLAGLLRVTRRDGAWVWTALAGPEGAEPAPSVPAAAPPPATAAAPSSPAAAPPSGPLADVIARFLSRAAAPPEVSSRDTLASALAQRAVPGKDQQQSKAAPVTRPDTDFEAWLERWVPRATAWQRATWAKRWRRLGHAVMWHVAATWAQRPRAGHPLLTVMLDDAVGMRAA